MTAAREHLDRLDDDALRAIIYLHHREITRGADDPQWYRDDIARLEAELARRNR